MSSRERKRDVWIEPRWGDMRIAGYPHMGLGWVRLAFVRATVRARVVCGETDQTDVCFIFGLVQALQDFG